MVLFDNIEDIFQVLRNFNEYSKALVTLATAVGSLIILFYTLKFVLAAYKDLRLYVCSRLCCQVNFPKRYGQWAVVTGSTDGIGLAMAKELAKRGMSIIVVGRNQDKLQRAMLAIEEEPNVGEVTTVMIDLADSSVDNYERIRSEIDPDNRDIGILVNNAGISFENFATFHNYDMRDLTNMVNVNVLATVNFTRMILPGMVERERGLILNVSSILGSVPALYMAIYGQTKAFIDSFSEYLQLEYGSISNLDIINLTPGPVHTKLFDTTTKTRMSSPGIPTPEQYASSSIAAVGAGHKSYAGTYVQEQVRRIMYFFDWFGLIPTMVRINFRLNAKNVNFSPKAYPAKKSTTTDEIQDTST